MNLEHLSQQNIWGSLLLAVATVYVTIYMTIRDYRLKREKAGLESKGSMHALYYRLQSGVSLFICKDWSFERVAGVIAGLTRRSSIVSCLIDFESFKAICGEEFEPGSLYTQSIDKDASIYPMYRDSGILWSSP